MVSDMAVSQTVKVLFVSILGFALLNNADGQSPPENTGETRVVSEKGPTGRRVFTGEDIKFPCVPSTEKYNLGSNVTYSWSRGEDTSLGPRYGVQKSGELFISHVEASDGEVLTCQAQILGGDTKIFNHRLEVVAVPRTAVPFTVAYDSGATCAIDIYSQIKTHIATAIGAVCQNGKSCTISENFVTCIGKLNRYHVTFTVEVNEKLEVNCTVNCPKPQNTPTPKEVRKTIHDKIESKDIKLESGALKFFKMYDKHDQHHCPNGFVNVTNLCHPCAPGTFLGNEENKKGKCRPCMKSSYAPGYASTQCISCKDDEVTFHEGSMSESDCLVFDNVGVAFLFLGAIVVVLLPCCCPIVICSYLYYQKTVTGEESILLKKFRVCISTIGATFASVSQQKPSPEQIPLLAEEGRIVNEDRSVTGLVQASEVSPPVPNQLSGLRPPNMPDRSWTQPPIQTVVTTQPKSTPTEFPPRP